MLSTREGGFALSERQFIAGAYAESLSGSPHLSETLGFGFVPEEVHLCQRHLGQNALLFGGSALDMAETGGASATRLNAFPISVTPAVVRSVH